MRGPLKASMLYNIRFDCFQVGLKEDIDVLSEFRKAFGVRGLDEHLEDIHLFKLQE